MAARVLDADLAPAGCGGGGLFRRRGISRGQRGGCGLEGGFWRGQGFGLRAGGLGGWLGLGFGGGVDRRGLQGAGGDHFGGEVADGLDHSFEPGDGFIAGGGNEILEVRAEIGFLGWGMGFGRGLAVIAADEGGDARDGRQRAAEEVGLFGGGWFGGGHGGVC